MSHFQREREKEREKEREREREGERERQTDRQDNHEAESRNGGEYRRDKNDNVFRLLSYKNPRG